MKQQSRPKYPMKLQMRILLVCLLTFVTGFAVTGYLNMKNSSILKQIEKTYFGNQLLMKNQEILQNIQGDVNEYLNTKSTKSLSDYYDKESEYRKLLKSFNTGMTGNEELMMEKNIYHMSESYLEVAAAAIQAKRGRDIEEYRKRYEALTEQYEYLSAAIYTLNNRKFEKNSAAYEEIAAVTRQNGIKNAVLIAVTAVLNMLLVLLLTGRLVKPLKNLVEASKKVGTGNLEIQLTETGRQDEIDVVMHAFNQMVFSLKQYILNQQESLQRENAMKEKAILAESHLKDAQLKYLRAQINPHFLFNTLNAGAQLAMMEEADGTYRYLHTVADFYRYAAQQDSGVVTVEKEIELIDDYMYILNVRYSGEIAYEKKVDPSVLEYRMPGMILQPIVENCVKHGLGELETGKKITLEAVCEEDQIAISVRDNGVGMKQELIRRLLKVDRRTEVEEPISESGGIGMKNVIARLRMYYDRDDIMEITSTEEHMGTEVTLYLPIGRKEDRV